MAWRNRIKPVEDKNFVPKLSMSALRKMSESQRGDGIASTDSVSQQAQQSMAKTRFNENVTSQSSIAGGETAYTNGHDSIRSNHHSSSPHGAVGGQDRKKRNIKRNTITSTSASGGVSVVCRVGNASHYGKTIGRPRSVSDEQHAKNLVRDLRNKTINKLQFADNAFRLGGEKLKEIHQFLFEVIQDLGNIELHAEFCRDSKQNDHMVLESGGGGFGDQLSGALCMSVRKMFSRTIVWKQIRHMLLVFSIKVMETYQRMNSAIEFVQQHMIVLSSLASQAIECRQSILPVLAEIRQVFFKGTHGETNSRVSGPTSSRFSIDPSSKDMQTDNTTASRAPLQSDVCLDSCKILSRQPVSRSTVADMKHNSQELKTKRRKEANIMTELKISKNPSRRAQLEAEMQMLNNSGKRHECKKARMDRFKNSKLAKSRDQLATNAYMMHKSEQENLMHKHSAAKSAGSEKNTRGALLYRKMMEKRKEKARRIAKNLERIKSVAFPEKNAPDLHVVSECSSYLAKHLDHLSNAFASIATQCLEVSDEIRTCVATMDAIMADVGTIRSKNMDGSDDQVLLSALQKLRVIVLPIVERQIGVWVCMNVPIRSLTSRIDLLYNLEESLQTWYNHGEGGLKTAYCSRNNATVRKYANANAPQLGEMYQHTMIQGVARVKHREDETMPLPCSSSSSSSSSDSQ